MADFSVFKVGDGKASARTRNTLRGMLYEAAAAYNSHVSDGRISFGTACKVCVERWSSSLILLKITKTHHRLLLETQQVPFNSEKKSYEHHTRENLNGI